MTRIPVGGGKGGGTGGVETGRQGAAGVQRGSQIQRSQKIRGAEQKDRIDQSGSPLQPPVVGETGPGSAPLGATKATPEASQETARALKNAGASSGDAQLQTIFDSASKAQEQIGKMSSVQVPARFKVREEKARPPVILGWLERDAVGPRENPTARTTFRPKDFNLRPFSVPESAVDGLRSGSMLELHLEQTEGGHQTYAVKARDSEYAGSFIANVVKEGAAFYAVGIASNPVYAKVRLDDPRAAELVGQRIVADVENPSSIGRSAKIRDVVGTDGSIPSKLLEIAVSAGVPIGFSAKAMAEVEELKKKPMTGKDFRDLPFVTIDNDDSKDLDQALCIKPRADGGFDVHYAIADVAYFVKEGMALDREARRRSMTTYLPGRSLPNLPPELSEDLISLNANVDRRAFIITVSLDKDGNNLGTTFDRGIIKSRAKLSYRGVQNSFDAGAKGALTGKEYSESLALLEKVGELRIKAAEARGVVPSDDNSGSSIHLGKQGTLAISDSSRIRSEMWNEQISLLANEAVAKKLRLEGVQAIFRSQPPPKPERVAVFREQVAELGVPWPESQSLQAYLAGLDPEDARTDLIGGLSVRMNSGASYGTEPRGHSSLKTEDYLHFTAPMRRYSDVINARILGALIEGGKVPYQSKGDFTLKQVVKLADDAKDRNKTIGGRAGAVVAASYWQDKIGQSFAGRVVGVKPNAITVQLADTKLNVQVPAKTLTRLTGQPPTLGSAGLSLETPAGRYKIGDAIDVTVLEADPAREILSLAPTALLQKAA